MPLKIVSYKNPPFPVNDVKPLLSVGYSNHWREQLHVDQKTIQYHKNNNLVTPTPILTRGKHPLIFKNTVNIIQGKPGVHKSHLAATLCVPFLKRDIIQYETGIGVQATFKSESNYTVVYVDTERSLTQQFPETLRNILMGANLEPTEEYEELRYLSLINVPRSARSQMVTEYLSKQRETTRGHMVVVLDVISDCITNFNHEGDSMSLVDSLNKMVNTADATILAIIHENPGTINPKARGHLGIELTNKASTVIQISHFGKGEGEIPVYRVAFLKSRDCGHQPPFYVQFDADAGLLSTASTKGVVKIEKDKKKVTVNDVCQLLPGFLTKERSRQEVLDFLRTELACSHRTLEDLLKEIIEQRIRVGDDAGHAVFLHKTATNPVIYKLTPAAAMGDQA